MMTPFHNPHLHSSIKLLSTVGFRLFMMLFQTKHFILVHMYMIIKCFLVFTDVCEKHNKCTADMMRLQLGFGNIFLQICIENWTIGLCSLSVPLHYLLTDCNLYYSFIINAAASQDIEMSCLSFPNCWKSEAGEARSPGNNPACIKE